MHGRVLCWLPVALLTLVLMEQSPAWATDWATDWASDGAAWDPLPSVQPAPPSLPDELRKITDWGGWRSALEQQGLQFTFTYYGDAFSNPIGGVKQGPGYDGRFGILIDGDLEKLVGWSGAILHVSIHQIHGTEFSAANLDNLMTVSGVEAQPSTRLFNLWIEQKFPDQINLRVGQFTAAQEFMVSRNADLFVNNTFVWPILNSQDLPSGGPSYPEATPGARLQFKPNNQITLRAAIFDGDPAGPGSGDPVWRDPYGLAFRVEDPPFLIAEAAYAYGRGQIGAARENPNQDTAAGAPMSGEPSSGSGLPGTLKIGAWVHTGSFADQRSNAQGEFLAVAGGPPLQHRGDYAVYGIVDQMLWRVSSGSDRGLSVFLRATAAPSDRNLIDRYADAGLTFKGPLASRPDDSIGLGFAFGRVSPQAAAFDRDVIAVTGNPIPVRDFEAAIELTYQWKLADHWYVQPDLQYILHPGGNIPNPLDPGSTSPIPNALVLGMRTNLRF
jgi:porin